ncbi:hypothetical protein B0T17DRAFT_157326 [Bombardia bombarda]|uniref:Uncharacterized protein n=1 Tax=Bombardia bombarda TaxID=252184 RepID=A0AA39X7I8_9PEZI|nr:hypothetical protein B0T17DRAFT_157326 [Bombardia bombarda]
MADNLDAHGSLALFDRSAPLWVGSMLLRTCTPSSRGRGRPWLIPVDWHTPRTGKVGTDILHCNMPRKSAVCGWWCVRMSIEHPSLQHHRKENVFSSVPLLPTVLEAVVLRDPAASRTSVRRPYSHFSNVGISMRNGNQYCGSCGPPFRNEPFDCPSHSHTPRRLASIRLQMSQIATPLLFSLLPLFHQSHPPRPHTACLADGVVGCQWIVDSSSLDRCAC